MSEVQKVIVAIAALIVAVVLIYPPGRDCYQAMIVEPMEIGGTYYPPLFEERCSEVEHDWIFQHDDVAFIWLLTEWAIVAVLGIGGLYLGDSGGSQ